MENRSIEFRPQIDGLRCIAVLGVMIQHWEFLNLPSSQLLNSIPFGTGVNLFYVISGFLISYILLKKKQEIAENKTSFLKEIKNFYVKRTLRIFPIYYLLLLLLVIFSYESIKSYLVYLLTYSVNWYMVYHNVFIGDKTHLWSLAVEEQFYLVWPFVLLLLPRRFILPGILLAIVISLGSKLYYFYSPYKIGVNAATFSCFDSFGFGALIAYLNFFHGSKFTVRPYKILLYVSILLYAALFVSPGFLEERQKMLFLNFATSIVFFFFVIIAANNGFTGGFKTFLENKTVLYLGKISYGLYLYHNFMGTLYFSGPNRLLPGVSSAFDFFVIYFVATVALASISWYVIERPVLGLKKYFN